MKAQHAILTTLAAVGAVLALCPSAYYNVAPNIERAAGDASMLGQVAVQIFCVIFLAVLPFVPYLFSRKGHTAMSVALVLFNAMVAFQTASHRHAADTGAINTAMTQAGAIDAKLNELRPKRLALGSFETAQKEQAGALQGKLDDATRDKRNCKRHCEEKNQAVTNAQNELDAMLARVTKTEEAKDLDAQIRTLEAQRLALGYVPESADQSSAQIASLIPFVSAEDVAKGWMLFQAFMIEILNRFGPVTMFWFIMGLGGYKPEEQREPGRNREIVRPKEEPAPVPSIELPAVPQVPACVAVAEPSPSIAPPEEPAPAALVDELAADEPAPLPPPPSRRKHAVSKRKPQVRPVNSGPSATVIPFRKDIASEVHAMLADGKSAREVADILGVTDRHVRRIRSAQMSADSKGGLGAQMSGLSG
jgi:hypothetical protein